MNIPAESNGTNRWFPRVVLIVLLLAAVAMVTCCARYGSSGLGPDTPDPSPQTNATPRISH